MNIVLIEIFEKQLSAFDKMIGQILSSTKIYAQPLHPVVPALLKSPTTSKVQHYFSVQSSLLKNTIGFVQGSPLQNSGLVLLRVVMVKDRR